LRIERRLEIIERPQIVQRLRRKRRDLPAASKREETEGGKEESPANHQWSESSIVNRQSSIVSIE
jgi:hypothetical protein